MNTLKYTIGKTAIDVAYTPIWWYTKGAVLVLKWLLNTSRATWNTLSISVWVKNIFTPMFQQYDWQGRLISFIMRVFQIIIRTIGFLILFIIYAALTIAWFVIPIFFIYIAFQHLIDTAVF